MNFQDIAHRAFFFNAPFIAPHEAKKKIDESSKYFQCNLTYDTATVVELRMTGSDKMCILSNLFEENKR